MSLHSSLLNHPSALLNNYSTLFAIILFPYCVLLCNKCHLLYYYSLLLCYHGVFLNHHYFKFCCHSSILCHKLFLYCYNYILNHNCSLLILILDLVLPSQCLIVPSQYLLVLQHYPFVISSYSYVIIVSFFSACCVIIVPFMSSLHLAKLVMSYFAITFSYCVTIMPYFVITMFLHAVRFTIVM